MGSKTGIGIATGIPFINKRKGGSGVQPLPPDLQDALVGVWIADQNNNDSSNRDTIKNKIPNAGGDFELLNFAYKLNSGYGKYKIDFDTWIKSGKITSTNSESFNFTTYDTWILLYYKSDIGKDMPSFKVHIKLEGEGKVYYNYVNSKGVFVNDIITQEEYVTPISYNTKYTGETPVNCGFTIDVISNKCSGTITQIPSFQGALVTDGVDDLITSTKTTQEMLGGSNEITVVSMINAITPYRLQLSYTNAFPINRTNTAPLRNEVRNTGKTGIYGYTYKNNVISVINNVLGDKNDYTTAITGEPQVDDRFEVTRTKFNSSVAWYWTFIAKKALTTDQINQVIAYYNLDKYVKPDIYYDVKKQGLSNDTPDADWYLKDFSGNGRDMQLYNYGKTPESGINEEGGLQSDGATDYGQFVGDLGLKGYTVAVDRAYPSLKGNGVPIVSNIRINTTTPFLFEFADNTGIVRPYSFGATTVLSPMELSRKISYQSTYIYNGNTINKGTIVDTGSGLTIGRFGGDQQYSNFALWSFLLFPYSLSEFLLERQLKRYKLGTLYPDMVEFRPIMTGNVPYKSVEIHQGSTTLYSHLVNKTGTYISKDEPIRIFISANGTDIVSSITVNGVTKTDLKLNANGKYWANFPITKSPQKIDFTIDEYIRYEDIVQPYPFIFPIVDTNNKVYSWGDKVKVGTEIKFAYGSNLLPQLYELRGEVMFNGNAFDESSRHIIGKTNIFTLTEAPKYLKDNEPNCILAPQTLKIPNASYKILGYIPDLTGKGNHGKINNSAYVGMSGANGYKYNWNTWRISKNGITSTITDNSLHITSMKEQYKPNQALFEPKTVADTGDKSNFKVNITGLTSNIKCTFNNAGAIIKELVNGVNEISVDLVAGWYGFMITALDNSVIGDCDITIQQIGQYEGSYCLDGVDDFITIPTLSHGAKQVLMKVNWNSINTIAYDHRNGVGNDRFAIYLSDEAIAYNARNSGQTYIDGILNTNIIASQLKDITHNITITNNDVNAINSGILRIGSAYTNSLYTQMALFTFMSFPEISSEDEIKELNDIVGIEGGYVESPDYYWDAYGKANRATQDIDYLDLNQVSNAHQVLIDKSKAGLAALELYHNTGNTTELNNRRLVANNFAFNEESGYDGWLGIGDLTTALNYKGDTTTNNWKRGGTFLKDRNRNDIRGCGYAFAEWFDKANYILKFKVKITGLIDTDELYICQYNTIDPEIKQQLFNGINEVILDLSASIEPTYQYISFRYPPLTNDVDFEFLYEYQNGLVSDGVDNHLINGIIPAFTDFTVISKRKFLNTELKLNETFCMKGDKSYLGGVGNAFVMEYFYGNDPTNKQTNMLSFGGNNIVSREESDITWCTPTSYNNITINRGEGGDTVGLLIGKYGNVYWKGVFYKMMLYSKTIDMLSINMLKNLFNQDILIDVKHPIFKNENSTSQST